MPSSAQQLELVRDPVRIALPAGVRAAWRRREKLTLTEWAERYVVLPPAVTSFSGPFRVSTTPYLRGVLDTWGAPHVRRTVFCAGPQTGKTLSAYLPLCYAMARAPGPALIVMSGQDGARKVMKDYIAPILHASPELARLIYADPDEMAGYRIRLSNGMRVYAAWATSPQLLKTFPARYGIGDEVDDWPISAGARGGDPEALFDVRLRTYPHTSKLQLVSTPGEEGGVWSKMIGCQEVRCYFARCPMCATAQRMVWPRVRWPDGVRDPAVVEADRVAAYECAECGSHWDDGDRNRAVTAGEWRAVDPAYLIDEKLEDEPFPLPPPATVLRPISVGFHLPSWNSRLVSLSKMVADFLRAGAKLDPVERKSALRVWTNSHPAKPWREEQRAPHEVEAIMALRDERPVGAVPDEALLLTLGVDTQDDGLWYAVRAWGADGTSWGVRHGFLARSVELGGGLVQSDFAALEAVLTTDYAGHRIRYGLVDMAGHRTDEVYRCANRLYPLLRPSRGEQHKKTAVGEAKVNNYPRIRRIDFDTTVFKDALTTYLQVTPGDPGAWRLHANTGDDYAAHFTAEYKDERGVWQQRGGRANHLWDCEVLNLVAFKILDGYEVVAKLAQGAAAPAPRPAPPVRPRVSMW